MMGSRLSVLASLAIGVIALADDPPALLPLSFEGHAVIAPGLLDADLAARQFVVDERYRVPVTSESFASMVPEIRSIAAVARALDLRWSFQREVYERGTTENALTLPPVVARTEPVPIVILPEPRRVVDAMMGAKPSAKGGVFVVPESVRPTIGGGYTGITVYVPRVAGEQVSDAMTPRMQGVAPSGVPRTPSQADSFVRLGRVVSRQGLMGVDRLGIYDDVIAQASTAMITHCIWYYRLEIANPHKGKRRGGKMGVLDDATILYDWCFPIMDANGQARPAGDARSAERASPYENLVTTRLIEFPLKLQQAPVVLPTAWDTSDEINGASYSARKEAYEGTETIVLPQRLIDAAGGIVIVRKASSWRPLAPDIVIDADTKNHTGILGVYLSQVVTDERLVDALAELCGKAPPLGAARDAVLEAVGAARGQR